MQNAGECRVQNAECRIKGKRFDTTILVGVGALDDPKQTGAASFTFTRVILSGAQRCYKGRADITRNLCGVELCLHGVV